MSLEPKNNYWQPNASFFNLQARAACLAEVRHFFEQRNVLEVETPLMCRAAATDPYLQPIPVSYLGPHVRSSQPYFLQTSPEYAMKRLLAAGSGPIYQICKVFRNDEVGRLHNPEFSLLEWYRPGFDHHDLMGEMEALLCTVLGVPPAEQLSYEAVFQRHLALNPHHASKQALQDCARAHSIMLSESVIDSLTTDDWLDVLMTHCIEPHLGFERPLMIYDYPASKAALAKVRSGNPPVAERFEVYVQGVELANGYHELTDPKVQQARFERDSALRKSLNYPAIPLDQYLLEALAAGLPACAGVALGLDRLLMLKLHSDHIKDVIAFTIERA